MLKTDVNYRWSYEQNKMTDQRITLKFALILRDHPISIMSSVPWQDLRIWKRSQSDAFEELCCQIAHSESVPDGATFRRKGTPDSGIECFWKFSDGKEWGWQAKFFPDRLDDQRWGQCDDSVRVALEGHPCLTRLYFCFPYAFPDARIAGRRSAADRWNEHQAKWMGWAADRGRTMEFILWDDHELTLRLSKAEHRGRWWFWFNGPAMDNGWFRRHVSATTALAAASDRYTSDFNVEVALAAHFEALGRTPVFAARLQSIGRKLNEAVERLGKARGLSKLDSCATAKITLSNTLAVFNALPDDPGARLNFMPLETALRDALHAVGRIRDDLWQRRKEQAALFQQQHGRSPDYYEITDDSFPHYNMLDGIAEQIVEALDFCLSQDAQLSGLPSMLLVGEPGTGKTQLVCTVAERRATNGEPTILMLGEQFDESDAWACILRWHGLSCDRDAFLGALNAVAEATGCRALIVIDAINEGAGIAFWNKHAPSMQEHLRHFPYVGFAVTVRKAYEKRLRGFDSTNYVRVEHHGFTGHTNEASTKFFTRYGLAEPSVPLLNPEFENPLLLKLLCRALSDVGGQISDEVFGVTSVFDLLLQSINRRLADEAVLDYDESENLVQRAVLQLAAAMAARGDESLPLEEAKLILLRLYSSSGHSKSLLNHLIAEHVVVRVPVFGMEETDDEALRFTYQRLSDHLIVKSVLALTSTEQLPALFETDGIFGKRMAEDWLYNIAGWIEALAIQLPERYALEIDEVLKEWGGNEVVRDAFIKSLVWRKGSAFTEATWDRVEALLQPRDAHAFGLLDELMAVVARPGHPFNADWLDRFLHPLSMAERDAFWSIYLFGQVNEESGIRRLIEWAWMERERNPFPDEVVRLAGMTLAWCLTTSDRFVRDRATKSLVALLEQRVVVLSSMLKHFADVQEPYLQERLYAVAYGCAMRTSQTGDLQSLAQGVYDRIFRDGKPPPSVLLRDHARGIVDCVVRRGITLEYDPVRIVPPFRSEWPKLPPTLKQLGKRYHSDDYNDPYQGLRRIFHSVTADDFEHYVIRDVTHWSGRRERGQKSQSPRQMFRQLLQSLSEEDVSLFTSYEQACRFIDGRRNDQPKDAWHRSRRKLIKTVDTFLPVLLGKRKARRFRQHIAPYLKNRYSSRYRETFTVELFQRLILSRVLELGWTTERFGRFDRRVPSSGRDSRKAERIGKKYQWIAYDEFHARISDNFGVAETDTPVMSDQDWEQGLWPLEFRDTDPSLLLKGTPRDGWGVNHLNWWTPHHYNAWTSQPTASEWLKSAADLPPPIDFLDLAGPNNNRWLMLEGFAHWRSKNAIGNVQSPDGGDKQELHYIIRSYLVRREHLPAIMAWGRDQNWINDRLPQPGGRYRQHLYEHYWSAHFDRPLDEEWVSELWGANDLPHPIVETTGEYICEHSTYDCSLDSTVLISLPSRWLAEKMRLKITGRRGDFVDDAGRLTAFDPSTRERGHGALAIRKDAFYDFLNREGLALFWTLLAEKNIYPPERMQSWLGRLTILGIYSWNGEVIDGSFRTEFTEGRS